MFDPVVLYELLKPRVKNLQVKGQELNFSCPFHKDKTPSAFMNYVKNAYHCFSCGAHYHIVAFMHELGVPKAYAIPLYDIEKMPELKEKLPEYEDYHVPKISKSLMYGMKLYEESMPMSSDKRLDKYMRKRLGRNWRCPIPVKFHIQRESLVFRGQTVVERFLRKDAEAKYKNHGPVTPVYDPNKKPAASLILVEGIFDFLSIYNAGYKDVAALLTTKITNRKLEVIDSLAKQYIFIGYDNDDAGFEALKKYINLLAKLNKRVFVYDLNVVGKNDFNQCSPQEIEEVMIAAKTYEEFMEERIRERTDGIFDW